MDALDKIGSSSHFLLSLINDILDISKIESGKMHLSMGPCDLRDIFRHIEDITALQAKNKTISITYMHDSVHHYKGTADELRIEQVLIHITGNAIHTKSNLKSFRLRASFSLWRCFIPVNVALLRLPPFSLAREKNPSRILELF